MIIISVLIEQKTNLKAKPKTPASAPDMFILIGVGELKCIIEVHFLKYYRTLIKIMENKSDNPVTVFVRYQPKHHAHFVMSFPA